MQFKTPFSHGVRHRTPLASHPGLPGPLCTVPVVWLSPSLPVKSSAATGALQLASEDQVRGSVHVAVLLVSLFLPLPAATPN